MENVNRYVGITHEFNGDSFDNADCIGLCRLFYKEHGWRQTFTDGKPVEADWAEKDKSRLVRYLRREFKETKNIDDLRFGDIVLFDICGEYHLGINLGQGLLLAMQVPVVYSFTKSTIYKGRYWKKYFVRGFLR